MDRRTFASALVGLLAWGCDRAPRPSQTATARPTTMKNDLVFVTRDGCVNTPEMLINLDDALRALGLPLDYQVVNLGQLPAPDARTGYPTPTVLYRNRDLFGMAEPTPPFPEPSWRVYKGGVPSYAVIQEKLKQAMGL